MLEPTFILGNSLDELKKIPENSIDLIFADPPYWMRVVGKKLQRVEGTDFDGCDDDWDNQFEEQEDYNVFTRQWLTECRRILKNNGSIWVIGGMQCIFSIGGIMQDLGFWFFNDVIWHKTNPTPNFKGTRLNNSHETLIWATKSEKSKPTFNYKTAKELNIEGLNELEFSNGKRKQLGSVWKLGVCQGNERLKNRDGDKLHTTQKPKSLLYRVIAISSRVGDIVLDPFGGTMTTGTVATELGRISYMLEQDEDYFAAGKKRIEQSLPFYDDIACASFDDKPPRVSIENLFAKKYLVAGETLYLKTSHAGLVKGTVILQSSGKVHLHGEEKDMHSAAGLVRNGGNRQNGWVFWHVKRGGEFVLLDVLRKQYRAQELGYVELSSRAPRKKIDPLTFEEVSKQYVTMSAQGFSWYQVNAALLPRLLCHAGLILLESKSDPYREHSFQLASGCYVRIIDLDSITTADFDRLLSSHNGNLETLYCSQNPEKLSANLSIQVLTFTSLFEYVGKPEIWKIYSRWRAHLMEQGVG